ncbi:aminotransferase class I/II-fold pyridoxal phosphate-dependent enzyme [bacterium]|nr:aminotransferase class I/II-fold pyridoxal phosphate-dependent enzyme [bacterium]
MLGRTCPSMRPGSAMVQQLLSLHRNEFHFRHGPRVHAILQGPVAAELVSSYSSRETLHAFVQAIGRALQVPSESVTLYHGAEDALFKILSWAASKGMSVQTTSWGWAEYMRMMQGLELKVLQTPLVAEDNEFHHPKKPFEEALANASEPRLVLLASPNNPTGHSVETEVILGLANRFRQHTFLIDRVYTEFSPEIFAALASAENVITLGSFSKFFGLPGLRCGFAIGNVPMVQSMALGPSPWALQVCSAALEDIEVYRLLWQQMKNTALSLKTITTPTGKFIKTTAPFVLFRCNNGLSKTAVETAQLKAGVRGKLIVAGEEIYLRWSLGSPEAEERIRKCIQALENPNDY